MPASPGRAAAAQPVPTSGAWTGPGCAAAIRTRPRRTELSRATTPRARRMARLQAMAAEPAVGVPHANESAAPALSLAYLSRSAARRRGGGDRRRTRLLHASGRVARVEVGFRVVVEVELAALAAEVVRRTVVLARQGRRLHDDLHPTDRVDRDRHDAASSGASGLDPGTPREYRGRAASCAVRA